MAGGYYYSTPIGAGMSNLAQAIAGGPKRELEAGLLQKRQALLDEQVKSELAQTALREAQTREHAAAAEKTYQYLQGISEMAGALKGEGPLPALAATPAAPTPTLSDAMTFPVSRGGPPGVPPQPVPNGGLSGAVVNLPSPAPSGPLPANPLQTLPSGPPSGALPQTMTMPLGGPAAANRTGITQDMVRKIAVAAARTGMKPDDLLMMFAGNNLAAQSTNDDAALGYSQMGSGLGFPSTITGGRETIASREKVAAANAAARSADSHYSTDARSRDNQYRVNTQEAGKNARARAKGDKPPKPLTVSQLKYIDTALDDEAYAAGATLTPQQKAEVRASISEQVASGIDMTEALDDALSNMFDVVPEHEEPGRFFGTNKVPKKATYRSPGAAPAAAPAPAPAPAAKPAAGKSIDALPPGAKQIGTSGGKPVYQTPDGRKFVGG